MYLKISINKLKVVLPILCILLYGSSALGEWVQVGGAPGLSGWDAPPKMDMYNNTPYIAGEYSVDIYVKYYNGSDWEQLGAGIAGPYQKWGCDIAFLNDTPYVTWSMDDGSRQQVEVKHFNGSSWEQDGGYLNIDEADYAYDPAIANNNGTPYVAWMERTPNERIFVKHYNGSAWISDGGILNVDPNHGAQTPDIAFYNGTPYVVWSEAGVAWQIFVRHYTGSVWNQDGGILNVDSNQNAREPSIAFSNNGTLYVAWEESNGTAKQIYVKHYTGSTWVQDAGSLNVDSNQDAQRPEIALYNLTPYVTWHESNSVADQIYVKYYNGSSWEQIDGSLNIDPNLGAFFPDIEINSNGVPYVSFINGSSAFVKHYATPTPEPTIYIYEIIPNYSTQSKNQNTTIVGYNFTDLPVVKLVAGGKPDVIGTNVVIKNNKLLTCSFNLNNIIEGVYDLRVESIGKTGNLTRAFHILVPNTIPLNWVTTDIGILNPPVSTGSATGIDIGDGDNNSLQEVYATNRNPGFFRKSWQGSAWTNETLPASPSGEINNDIIICDGDNNGVKEIYIAAQDNHVYQYGGANWDKVDVGSGSNKMKSLAYGDGNNDGQIEIYAACEDGFIYQFNYNGGWNGTTIAASSVEMRAVAVGDADNDNEFEVYAADINHKVYEISYGAGQWNQSEVGSGAGIMNGLVVADGDGNDTRELYGANEDYKIYRFVKQISDWQKSEIGAGNGVMFDLAASDGDNSGTVELYGACGDGHVYQIEYVNDRWLTNDIGAAQTPLYALTIGDGMNDNQYEIYAVGENSHVYQFKAVSYIPTPTPIPNFGGKIISKDYVYCAPNPARGNHANVVIHTQQAAEISVKMFTTNNREVLSFRISCPGQGKYTKRVNIGNLANGVYLLFVKARTPNGDEEKVIKKMALIK